MLFSKLRQKELKMVWKVETDGKSSFMVGTSHFFPRGFKSSLTRLLKDARVALFEGPLDEASMARVVEAGYSPNQKDHFFDYLEKRTVEKIVSLLTPTESSRSVFVFPLLNSDPYETIYSMVRGMKPWMAFFAIYTRFLEKHGWKHSVDIEAYRIAEEMEKQIVFLETIEEQIEVLEGISVERIIDFVNRIDSWKFYSRNFEKWYLSGDLEKIKANQYGFPTRDPWIIDRRDSIMYKRMLPYITEGQAVAFVGVPHVVGIRRMLVADGFIVSGGSQ